VIKKDGVVTLINRHGIDYTRRLTEIVDAAKAIKGDFTIDTEAVFVNQVTKEVEFTPCQGLFMQFYDTVSRELLVRLP